MKEKPINSKPEGKMEDMDKPNLLARSLASKKKYRFACMIPTFHPKDYWERIDKGFDLARQDFGHYNVTLEKMYFDQYDINSFVDISEKVLASKPDAVILSPIFKEETIVFTNELEKLDIPFSYIDSVILDSDFHTYYGQNSFQSGYIAAKLLLDLMPEKAQVMVIRTKRKGSEANQTITRYDGFMKYIYDKDLEDYIEIVDVEFIENEEESNFKTLEKVFATNKNIKAAITFNSKVYRLAMHLATFGRKDIRIIGYDLVSYNVTYLKQGVIHCLIAQRPQKQAFLSVKDMCRELILKQETKKINYMPMDIIFKENLEDYVNFGE